jgi:tRNA(Ile)-lysidine synthase
VNNDVRDTSIVRALRATFHRGETVVAAVSGGGDSMAMLHALCELAPELDLTVIAAHFDHQLRPYSHLDADLVFRMAHRWGARVAPGRGDVRAHRMKTRTSIEAAAREMRYAFLERVAEQTRADAIVTAHSRDDQIETVLMRIRRGAGPRGRRGILSRRGLVVRPLLDVARADMRAYCVTHGVPFLDDPTNHDLHYDRNRVRHEVLPELRRVFPQVDRSLLKIARLAALEFERGEEVAEWRVPRFLRPEGAGSWLLDVDAFAGLDADDCFHLLNALLEHMHARTDVSARHHEMLLALIGARLGTTAYLPGLRVRREHDGLFFEDPQRAGILGGVSQPLREAGVLDMGAWRVEASRVNAPSGTQLSNTGKSVAYLGLDGAMLVRYPREGDRMQPFGMNGHKKLSDLFIDRKVPHRMRETTPVVEVDGEIVWVVGVATSERCRIGQGTGSVVKLTATRRKP